MIAGVRTHWNGLFAFGAPDVQVVNVTKDAIWTRSAVLPELAGQNLPPLDKMFGDEQGNLPDELEVPQPRIPREAQQEQATRDTEIDPKKYMPANVYREPGTKLPNPMKINKQQMEQMGGD